MFDIEGTEKNSVFCLTSSACNFSDINQSPCPEKDSVKLSCTMDNPKCMGQPFYTFQIEVGETHLTYGRCFADGECAPNTTLEGYCRTSTLNLPLILGITTGAVVVIVGVVVLICVRRRRN